MTQYQVMGYRIAIPETGLGEGEIVTLPQGWEPLAAVRQGETALVLCCQPVPAPPVGPAPTLDALSPDTLTVGGPPATVDVTGTGFDDTCQVCADGQPRATFYLDDTHLQYTARPDLQTGPATVEVTVKGGNGTSSALPFSFTAPWAVQITGYTPDPFVCPGSGTITGTGLSAAVNIGMADIDLNSVNMCILSNQTDTSVDVQQAAPNQGVQQYWYVTDANWNQIAAMTPINTSS